MPRTKSPARSNEQRTVLIELYPTVGVNEMTDAYPNRSGQAVYVMANRPALRTISEQNLLDTAWATC